MQLERYNGRLEDADFVNLLMVSIYGNIRSVSLPGTYASEKVLNEGIGFDASNYGYAKVNNSDMVAIPDMTTNMNCAETAGCCTFFATLSQQRGRSLTSTPCRNIVKKTKEYIKKEGVADNAKVLVELEYYVFEDVEYSTGADHANYRVTSSEGMGGFLCRSKGRSA